MTGSGKKSKTHKPATRSGSLMSPEAMGALNAGKGFDFQMRFAACRVPILLLEAAFHQLFYEGSGDIDVRYQENGQSRRLHIQVKDHEVSLAVFKKTLKHFRALDADLPHVYNCFTLVCPSLAPKLRTIETGLARYRRSKPFYDDNTAGSTPTKEDLDSRLKAIGLSAEDIAFVHERLSFDIGHGDLQHDDRAAEIFVARLLAHPDYEGKMPAAVRPAFAPLLKALQDKRGHVLTKDVLEDILRASVTNVQPIEPGVTLWMQNWTREAFDIPADYTIDWSRHFDRDTRRVPSPSIWNGELLPELRSLRDRIQLERKERLIRLRGRCPLSSGIALGAVFPSVGGWKFEIPQPPSPEPWRSDAIPASPYQLKVELVEGAGDDLVVGLNIRGDGRDDVRRYLESTGRPARMVAYISTSDPGAQAIAGPSEAAAFARSVRETLGGLLKTHNLKTTRLFFYGPLALAVFLGQQLTSVGEIQLFEYQDPSYVPSCTLRT